GRYDALTPIEGLYRIDADMKAAYARCGAPENWRMVIDDCGHRETAHMRREILSFLKQNL
ncbi:MAG: alpha/beta hydrolase, partial [Clostridia bacterium]|nr:alpha/beta hydrolase [Clostridia bacterium]